MNFNFNGRIMNNEIIEASPQLMTDIGSYLTDMGSSLNENQKQKFIAIARAFNLNPFKREIHGVVYGTTFNIVVGYEVYLKRAERTGKLSGWKAWTEGEGETLKAFIKIWRKDWEQPFEWEADFSECKQMAYDKTKREWRLNRMWATRSKFMLKKTVIGQGFRLAFSDELGGMPYTEEESKAIIPEYEEESVPSDETVKIRRKLRAAINKSLTNAKSEREYDEIIVDFEKDHPGLIGSLTLHNETETFASLATEHFPRIKGEESKIVSELQEKFEELYQIADDEDGFRKAEKLYVDNQMLQDFEENKEALNRIGRHLNIEGY